MQKKDPSRKGTFLKFIKKDMDHTIPEFILGSVATLGLLPLVAYVLYRSEEGPEEGPKEASKGLIDPFRFSSI